MNTNKTRFDTKALRKLILNYYVTIKAFAEVVGMNPQTLGRKLNGKSEFDKDEIIAIRDALKLNQKEVDRYFFTEEDFELRSTEKAILKLTDEMTDDEIELLAQLMDLTIGNPARRKFALAWTGKMKDLPAALAQI